MGFGVVVCLQIVQMIIIIRMIGLNKVNLYYKHYYSIYGSFFFFFLICILIVHQKFQSDSGFFGSGTRIFGRSQTKGLSAKIWTK
jgi:hypothetical protein